ncbi:hypothetical protein PAPYR_2511 [Paratrimastix pyriformis]|uniref:GED domain-containing protein n=1 Tax=Paratrimastix pyriformis TaxID=342808 RepID=A0ABQ8UPG4_9EUKA|nr:hypothetical protein PAPYR_2511 [Paratrimastix pyriformis]
MPIWRVGGAVLEPGARKRLTGTARDRVQNKENSGTNVGSESQLGFEQPVPKNTPELQPSDSYRPIGGAAPSPPQRATPSFNQQRMEKKMIVLLSDTIRENTLDGWRLFRDILNKLPLDYFTAEVSPQIVGFLEQAYNVLQRNPRMKSLKVVDAMSRVFPQYMSRIITTEGRRSPGPNPPPSESPVHFLRRNPAPSGPADMAQGYLPRPPMGSPPVVGRPPTPGMILNMPLAGINRQSIRTAGTQSPPAPIGQQPQKPRHGSPTGSAGLVELGGTGTPFPAATGTRTIAAQVQIGQAAMAWLDVFDVPKPAFSLSASTLAATSTARPTLSPATSIRRGPMMTAGSLAVSRSLASPPGGTGGLGASSTTGGMAPDGHRPRITSPPLKPQNVLPDGAGPMLPTVSDTPDKQATAFLRTSQDAITYFAESGHSDPLKFVYLNRAPMPPDEWRPYDLVVVPRDLCAPEHFVMSVSGVVHVLPKGPPPPSLHHGSATSLHYCVLCVVCAMRQCCLTSPRAHRKSAEEEEAELLANGPSGSSASPRVGGRGGKPQASTLISELMSLERRRLEDQDKKGGRSLEECEALPLAQWVKEASYFNVLRSILFFQSFPLVKTFYHWQRHVRFQLYCRNRKTLRKGLYYAHDCFCGPLQKLGAQYLRIKESAPVVVNLDQKESSYDPTTFMALQAQTRDTVAKTMRAVSQEAVQVITNVVTDVLARAYPEAQEAAKGDATGSGRTAQEEYEEAALTGILKSIKQEKLERARAIRLAQRQELMLGRFVQLADHLCAEALFGCVMLGATTLHESMQAILKQRNKGIFNITFCFDRAMTLAEEDLPAYADAPDEEDPEALEVDDGVPLPSASEPPAGAGAAGDDGGEGEGEGDEEAGQESGGEEEGEDPHEGHRRIRRLGGAGPWSQRPTWTTVLRTQPTRVEVLQMVTTTIDEAVKLTVSGAERPLQMLVHRPLLPSPPPVGLDTVEALGRDATLKLLREEMSRIVEDSFVLGREFLRIFLPQAKLFDHKCQWNYDQYRAKVRTCSEIRRDLRTLAAWKREIDCMKSSSACGILFINTSDLKRELNAIHKETQEQVQQHLRDVFMETIRSVTTAFQSHSKASAATHT